jgi:hypothetical protein
LGLPCLSFNLPSCRSTSIPSHFLSFNRTFSSVKPLVKPIEKPQLVKTLFIKLRLTDESFDEVLADRFDERFGELGEAV